MLEPLFGTINKEHVLLYVFVRGEGYPRGVAKFFATDLRSIQNQFKNLEKGGVLQSRKVGNTKLYTFDPKYPCLFELKVLLEKVLSMYPENERELLEVGRKRSV